MITSTISSKSSFVMIAPVGLFGKGMTRIFVLSVIAPNNSSFVSLNPSSSRNAIGTGTPSARTIHGSYDT